MVTQCNLLTSSILFLDDTFFFHFFFEMLLIMCSYSYSFLGIQVVWCNSLRFFIGCERGLRYDFSLFIYIIMEASGMGYFFFIESSSLRMVSREANIGNNNLGTRRLSSGFCTIILILQLHSILNLWQIDLWVCVSLHTFFCITIV